VNGRMRSRTLSAGRALDLRGALLGFAVIVLTVTCSLAVEHRVVAAQEVRQADELRSPILDFEDDETAQDESGTNGRVLIDIGLLPDPTDGIQPKGTEPPDEPGSQTAVSQSELWQVVLQLKQDFEMLKEEIAELRSELRSIMPEPPDTKPDTKRTITPFWISDVQSEETEAGGG